MKIDDAIYLCVKKKIIFMYFLSYYKPCAIDSVKNRALLKNLPKKNMKIKSKLSLLGKKKE